MRQEDYQFWVYILSNRSHILYIGMTNSLRKRVMEHRKQTPGTFTARYKITRLVYCEQFQYVNNAIAREKELKKWTRAQKIALIEAANPTWEELMPDELEPAFFKADSLKLRHNITYQSEPMTTKLKPRTGTIKRSTTETQIALKLTIDGQGVYKVSTGIRFFDHMLELFTRHGGFDLALTCTGDLDVDQHHTVEDVGIALGEAFNKALGDKKGILRAGYFVMAMDETLAVAAVDLSGRVAYVVDDKVKVRLVGDFRSELLADFFDGFARGAKANVHVKTMYGRSNHHKIEAIFKAFARALRGACSRDERMKDLLPSTKGLL